MKSNSSTSPALSEGSRVEAASVEAARCLFGKVSRPLGFGTGFLHHAGDRATAVRLVKRAYDEGVRWFDTARLYGEGRCEGIVGEALKSVRSELILVTKVGILPPARDLGTRINAKSAAMLRRFPQLRARVPEPVVQHPVFGVFDAVRMRQSLETSLRQLRTDHVDLLLLHECTPEDLRRDEVRAFLDQTLQQGKVRAWGVAPCAKDMQAIAAQALPLGQAAQFDAGIRPHYPPEMFPSPSIVITHSCLSGRFQRAVRRLAEDPALRQQAEAALGGDWSTGTRLAQLVLAHAVAQNPNGIVLFSTTRQERLKENLAADAMTLSPGQAGVLSGLVGEV